MYYKWQETEHVKVDERDSRNHKYPPYYQAKQTAGRILSTSASASLTLKGT